jgi:uncharacterized membrane protein
MENMESKARTLVKTISFRIIIVIISTMVFWNATQNVSQTTLSSIIFNVAATAAYYIHERIWVRIKWDPMKKDSSKSDFSQNDLMK